MLIKMTASDWGNRWTMTRGNVSTKVSEFTPLAFVAKKKKKTFEGELQETVN